MSAGYGNQKKKIEMRQDKELLYIHNYKLVTLKENRAES